MSGENVSRTGVDMGIMDDVADRIVAANLTNAIYTRLDTLQSGEEYNEATFDDVARHVVREVMQTYSALLGVLRGMPDDDPGTEDNGQ